MLKVWNLVQFAAGDESLQIFVFKFLDLVQFATSDILNFTKIFYKIFYDESLELSTVCCW